jgi:hypothetical protein
MHISQLLKKYFFTNFQIQSVMSLFLHCRIQQLKSKWNFFSKFLHLSIELLKICFQLVCPTFWILCCGVRNDFCIKTMFGSSLPPFVCRRAHVLFTLFVLFLFCFSLFCVPYIASFSVLSIFDCHLWYSLTFIYIHLHWF